MVSYMFRIRTRDELPSCYGTDYKNGNPQSHQKGSFIGRASMELFLDYGIKTMLILYASRVLEFNNPNLVQNVFPFIFHKGFQANIKFYIVSSGVMVKVPCEWIKDHLVISQVLFFISENWSIKWSLKYLIDHLFDHLNLFFPSQKWSDTLCSYIYQYGKANLWSEDESFRPTPPLKIEKCFMCLLCVSGHSEYF